MEHILPRTAELNKVAKERPIINPTAYYDVKFSARPYAERDIHNQIEIARPVDKIRKADAIQEDLQFRLK